MSEKGWFLVDRKFFSHFLWTERREYSKAEAWIDLIALARYSKEKQGEKMINGQLIKWERGQLIASIRFLRKRWNWKSNTKVESFLKLLEKEDMILRETKTPVGRITICNYDRYQEPKDTGKDTYKTGRGQAEDETVKKGLKKDKQGYPFSDFWNDYNKKKERSRCEKKWDSISDDDKELIKEFIPAYKKNEPEVKYRKDPINFLSSEIWKDDLESYRSEESEFKMEHYL